MLKVHQSYFHSYRSDFVNYIGIKTSVSSAKSHPMFFFLFIMTSNWIKPVFARFIATGCICLKAVIQWISPYTQRIKRTSLLNVDPRGFRTKIFAYFEKVQISIYPTEKGYSAFEKMGRDLL